MIRLSHEIKMQPLFKPYQQRKELKIDKIPTRLRKGSTINNQVLRSYHIIMGMEPSN